MVQSTSRFEVVGVSTTPKVSLMGLPLRNLVRAQKVLKPPGRWTSDIPEAASSWTTWMITPRTSFVKPFDDDAYLAAAHQAMAAET